MPAVFTLTAYGSDGKRRLAGGDDFAVEIEGPCKASVVVRDRGDGMYELEYVLSPEDPDHIASAPDAIDLRIHVTSRDGTGGEVLGSPFRARLATAFRGTCVGRIGERGGRPLQFDGPGSMVIEGDLLYIGDGDNNRYGRRGIIARECGDKHQVKLSLSFPLLGPGSK